MSKQDFAGTVDQADIVIVGNGIAGLTAAVEARRLQPEKNVVIVTSQSHPTINTPALKQFAIGKLEREQLLAYPAGTERLQRIHLVNASVEEIHAQEGYIRLAGGQGFGYNSLLLATGSRPTGLPADMPGQDFDGVLTLHRLYDYLDLRRRLPEVEEAVVIGGGAHAIETVMGMLYWGIRVHWLIRSETFMPRQLDRQASEMVLEGTRRAGAKVYTETEVIGIVGRVGSVAGVVTTTQQMLPCQLVLVCTGTAPVTTLARTCDLPVKYDRGGILVDDQLRTSVRNIYAAGDVAALRDPLTGKYMARPQWYAAVLQGRAVAAAMTGVGEPENFGVPWHATRLGDISMLTVGNPLAWPESVTPLAEKRKGSYCLLSLLEDRLVGYLSLGSAQPDSLAIKRIIDEGLSVREITKDLLRGELDARKYFSGKRTYAAQRMITTGQLPTPLPLMPGIVAGESRMPRLPAPDRVNAQLPAASIAEPRRGETAARLDVVQPLARIVPQQGETAARMNAVQPPGSSTEPRAGQMAARFPGPPPMMAPQRGETAARMNAVQPPGSSTEPRAGQMAARFPGPPPGMMVPGDDTEVRMKAMQPPGSSTEPRAGQMAARFSGPPPGMMPPEGASEAWVNAPPPVTPQGGPPGGWLNGAPPPMAPRGRPAEVPPRRTDNLPHPGTEPLVRPAFAGSRQVAGPRPPVRNTDERWRIAGQQTLIGAETDPAPAGRAGKKQAEGVGELVGRPPDRQFIAPPVVHTNVPSEKEKKNPHPSRSLWHYTDQHPVVKGKKYV
jgi:NADPH-dependent 2,4-dienoyl-CoA reductase/sulfur reductase-like enzyme